MLRWLSHREFRGNIYATALSPNQRAIAVAGVGVRTTQIAVIDRFTGEILHGLSYLDQRSLGPVDGLWAGVTRVWEVSALSLRLLGRMAVGELSLKNLSGPIAIADYAGKSASLGLTYYLAFLAFISVSLGVLNLLPIPVLDGGHLMYYLWEAVTGKPVTGVWLERLQYVGMGLLLTLMTVAMFNDVVNRWG